MQKPILAAGLDPGTTTGICLLDLEGAIVFLGSSKELSFGELIDKTLSFGRPIIVGSDKRNAPELVMRYATKFGARLVLPDHDLLIKEKKSAVKEKTRNSHEFDSLACARFALKEIQPLLVKIKSFAAKNKVGFSEIAAVVIKEGIPISVAAELLKKPDAEEARVVKQAISQESVPKDRVILLYDLLKKERDSVLALRKEKEALAQDLTKAQSVIENLKLNLQRRLSDEKAERLLQHRNCQIHSLGQQLLKKSNELQDLKIELQKNQALLADLKGKVVLKRLKNLGSQEFEKKELLLKIAEGDYLLVDDPTIVSEKVIKKLSAIGAIILSRKSVAGVLNAQGLSITEAGHYAVADRQSLEKEIAGQGFLRKLIRDYRDSRS